MRSDGTDPRVFSDDAENLIPENEEIEYDENDFGSADEDEESQQDAQVLKNSSNSSLVERYMKRTSSIYRIRRVWKTIPLLNFGQGEKCSRFPRCSTVCSRSGSQYWPRNNIPIHDITYGHDLPFWFIQWTYRTIVTPVLSTSLSGVAI